MLDVKVKHLTGIMVYVPRVFLERFDESIVGMYPSRSEAVRRGMALILKEIRDFEKHSCRSDETALRGGDGKPAGGRPHE